MPRRLPARIQQEEKQRRLKGRNCHFLPSLTFELQTKVGERLEMRIDKVGRKSVIAEKLGQTEEKNWKLKI